MDERLDIFDGSGEGGSSNSELSGNRTLTGSNEFSALGSVRLLTNFLKGLFLGDISLDLITLLEGVGEGPLRGEAEAEIYEVIEGLRDGEGEIEFERARVPQGLVDKRDICTFSWLIHRAT